MKALWCLNNFNGLFVSYLEYAGIVEISIGWILNTRRLRRGGSLPAQLHLSLLSAGHALHDINKYRYEL